MDSGFLGVVATGFLFGGLALLVVHELAARRSPWPLTVVLILAGWPIVVTVNTPRTLTHDANAGIAWMDASQWQEALSIPAWILTTWLAAYVAARVVSRGWQLLPRDGLHLFVAHLACVSGPLVAALLGTPGGELTHALFRPHLMLAAIVLAAGQRPRAVLAGAKWGALAYVAGSLLAVGLAPEWALLESGEFLGGPLPIPRLFGVGGHPNGLAPIALAYLYLEYNLPSPRLLRVAGGACALLTLVLTQSKTSWAIFLVAAAIVAVYRSGERGGTTAWAKLALAVGSSLAVIALLGLPEEIPVANVDVATLTGRTELWGVALAAWATSPVFGYGPTLWSEEFRVRFLTADATYAGHSHNMFIQQLAESGAVGLAALLAFFLVLSHMCWRARYASRGLSLVILVHLLMNSMTESTLVPRSMDQTMFGIGVIVALAIRCCGESPGRRAEPSVDDAPWLTASASAALGPGSSN